MKLAISFDTTRVDKRMDKLSRGVSDFTKPLKETGEDLQEYFSKDVFDSQGKELGVAWKNLASSTLRARALRTGYYANTPSSSPKILVWTGNLRKGFIKFVTKFKLEVTNNDENFIHNQKKRPMLGINKTVIEKALQRFQDYIHSLNT